MATGERRDDRPRQPLLNRLPSKLVGASPRSRAPARANAPANTGYTVETYTTTTTGARYRPPFAEGDPADKAASLLLGESGWRSRWTVIGCRNCALLTPAAAIGNALIADSTLPDVIETAQLN